MTARTRLDQRLAISCALLVVAIAYGAVAQGAFFGPQLAVLQVIVVLSLVAAWIAVPPRRSDLRSPATIAALAVVAATIGTALLDGHPFNGLPQSAFARLLKAPAGFR